MRRLLSLAAVVTACHNDDIHLETTGESLAAESMSSITADPTSSSSGGEDGSTSGAGTTSSGGTTDPSTTSGGGDDGCSLSRPCEVGYCVAPYADNERGAFACIDTCVGPNDAASWCFDATACCDPAAICTSRGYCVGPDDASSSGADSGGSGDTTG